MIPHPHDRNILLYAHRGACQVYPENSLEAFARAIEDGADAIELDVHATSDNHFVVFHDTGGARLTGQPHAIRSRPLNEIKRWRLGGTNCRIATLDELLTAFPRTRMSIDLKPNKPALVALFLDLLARHSVEDFVTIASFHQRVMTHVRKSGWAGRTALSRQEVSLLRFAPESLARRLIRGDAAQIPRSAGPVRLDRDSFLKRCHRLGLRADFWVVNEPSEAHDLLVRGATGLMTDDPVRLAPVVREFRQLFGKSEPSAADQGSMPGSS